MKSQNAFSRFLPLLSAACLAVVLVTWPMRHWAILSPALIAMFASLALYSMGHPALKFRRPSILALIACAGIALGVLAALYAPTALLKYGGGSLPKTGLVLGLLLVGIVAVAKLVIDIWIGAGGNRMDRVLPIVSMVAICCIIAIITARSSKELLSVGALLILSTMIHNGAGYLLGYWMARAARLTESSCRAVAFEVGMQNGGMASAVAMNVLNSIPAALAPAIFGPWQNVSGSILATWWHRVPVAQAHVPIEQPAAEAVSHES